MKSVILATVAAVALSAPASAQTADLAGLLPSSVAVGGYMIVTPKYEGSKDYKAIAFPIAIPGGVGDGDGVIQFRGIQDIRLRAIRWNGLEAGPLAGWRFGRDEDASRRLKGLGDVDGGFVAGGYAGYRIGQLMPFVSYHHQLTGDDTGGFLRAGIESRLNVVPGVSLLAIAATTWADKDYNSSFFGVTKAQSAASRAGLAAYSAGSGIKDAFLDLSADVPLSTRWTLKLNGRYTRLLGDAADSPIVETENQFYAGLGLTYSFSLK